MLQNECIAFPFNIKFACVDLYMPFCLVELFITF